MGKLYKFKYFIGLFFLFSCYSSRIPNDVLKVIEAEDDSLCIMQGVDFNNPNTKIIYWECRLRILNQRINSEFVEYGYSMFYRREFKRLRRIIKNKIKEEKAFAIAEIENSLEEKEHNYCVMLKHQNIGNTTTKYDYFKCRESLAQMRENSSNYFDMSNENIVKFYLYDYETITPEEYSKIMNVEKDCVKYVYDLDKLLQCKTALKNISQCKNDIPQKLAQRRMDDKIYCTKKSINKYPDSLAIFNTSDSKDNKDSADTENSNDTNFNVSGPKVDKLDVVELREKEYTKCISERNARIVSYQKYLESECREENFKKLE